MKLKVVERDNAVLNVQVSQKEHTSLYNVPLDNLIDWYPFSNAYEYRLSKDNNCLELKRLRSTLPVSYGIDSNYSYLIKNSDYQCKIGEWYNKAVCMDNIEVIEKAKKYKLPVITEPFNLDTIEKGFHDIGVIFQSVKTIIIDRYLDNKNEEEIKLFKTKSDDIQFNEALKHSDNQVNYTYNDLGKIYNMLLLMKKICKAS